MALRKGKPGYDPRVDGVTFGLLQRWLACRHQAKYAIEKWSPAGTKTSFLYGDLIHAALENLHCFDGTPSSDLVDQTVEVEAERLRADRGSLWSAEEHEEFEILQAQAHGVMRAYFRYYAKRNARTEFVATEEEFAFRLDGLLIRGKMDGKCRFLGKGKRKPTTWLFETKTRGMNFDGNLGTTLVRDLQSNIYILALASQGEDPKGVLYNEVRRPGLRPLKGRGKEAVPESLAEYEDRIEADALADATKYFRRLEIAITPADILTFEAELRGMLAEFMRWWEAGMPGWRYGMPCMGKYGACPYLGLCFEGSTVGLRKREVMFEELAY